jgi:hypothetical protein
MQILLNKSLLQCTLNGNQWVLQFSDKFKLEIECLWRIETKTGILFTNNDHLQKFGLTKKRDILKEIKEINLKKVTGMKINRKFGDLTLEFDNKYILNCINQSSGYEAWNIIGPKYSLTGTNKM